MSSKPPKALLPSDVDEHVGLFDRFASAASSFCARAPFFAFCVLLVVVWAPSILILRDIDKWQLVINTVTTVVTFLIVALIQNSETRADQAVQHKLNAVAYGLLHLMEDRGLEDEAAELHSAIGLERRETST